MGHFFPLTPKEINRLTPQQQADILTVFAHDFNDSLSGASEGRPLNRMLDDYLAENGPLKLAALELALTRYANAIARKALGQVEVLPLKDLKTAIRHCVEDTRTANSFIRQTEIESRRSLVLCGMPLSDLRSL